MSTLNQQSFITVVNQSQGKPTGGIPGDRASALGNPFDMQRDERLRNPVCDGYDEYFNAVVAGAEPVPTAIRVTQERSLRLASTWKRPSRSEFMGALAVLEQRQAEGKPSKIMCWCAPSRCHLDTVKAYLDNQRTLQTPDILFRAMPEAPTAARTQTSTIPTTEVMETDIADSIQLIGQLPQPMLDALAARLETVKDSLNADVSNYARGRLNTWIGVQWDLKAKQFIPAGFWDEQLWEFGQRVYPGAQMLLLTYSGDGTGNGTGIGLHRDDSYARFEARTVSLETQGTESTWFMRQTYPGMGYVKGQNETAGVHEFGLPSGSVITFNCKNQHAVEPGTGRWSLNLWQVSDKHQTAYKTFVETYGQSGGAVPHRVAGKDLLLPKPLHLTEAQRQQLNAPTVRRIMSVAEFNSRPKTTSSAPRERRTANTKAATTTTATETPGEPTVYQWSRYAPAGKEGYECSTQGDRRFSALNARLRDGRTIEEAYQLDVKGYRVQGNDWKLGKGKPPLEALTPEALYNEYKALWQQWARENPELMDTLAVQAKGKVLTDKFASSPVSQARALSELLNERQTTATQVSPYASASPDRITSLEPHQVFVFGSNTQGRHGKGAALQAVNFGAEYGNPSGRQGQSYAIVTKDLTKPQGQQSRSVSLHDIEQQVTEFLDHANAHPENEFLVTRFGCDLAGYSEQEIGRLWVGKAIPSNVRLPQAFLTVVQADTRTPTTEGVKAMTALAATPTSLTVISGGQTGADFGGLKAGKALGLTTGGTAPHGWLVERCARFPNGTNPGLADYGLVEGPRGNNAGHTYILRTEMNVRNSDGTLVLGSIDPAKDKGSYRTVELAEQHSKPCLHVSTNDLFSHPNESVLRIKDWVLEKGIETLNVAGNRESKCPGLEDRVETVLKVALAEIVRGRTAHEVEQQTTNAAELEQSRTLGQQSIPVTKLKPTPARYLIYADHECCPQSESPDVQAKTCLLTQKAFKEAEKRGYAHVEVIVATLNENPVNLECLQPLVAAAQHGVSQALGSAAQDSPLLQADVYESPDAQLDLLDLQGNPDNRLLLISNGKGLGTQQMVQQAEKLGVKVIGYDPEKQTFLGAAPPQPGPVTPKAGKGSRGVER